MRILSLVPFLLLALLFQENAQSSSTNMTGVVTCPTSAAIPPKVTSGLALYRGFRYEHFNFPKERYFRLYPLVPPVGFNDTVLNDFAINSSSGCFGTLTVATVQSVQLGGRLEF